MIRKTPFAYGIKSKLPLGQTHTEAGSKDAQAEMRNDVFYRVTQLALAHLEGHNDPRKAWDDAALFIAIGPDIRDKERPKSAFVSLARHGYLICLGPTSNKKPLSRDARQVLYAAGLINKNPHIRHRRDVIWTCIRGMYGIGRKTDNGVLGVLAALVDAQALRKELLPA